MTLQTDLETAVAQVTADSQKLSRSRCSILAHAKWLAMAGT